MTQPIYRVFDFCDLIFPTLEQDHQLIRISFFYAREILTLFEKSYPGEPLARQAVDAVSLWLQNPSEDNREKVRTFASACSEMSARFSNLKNHDNVIDDDIAEFSLRAIHVGFSIVHGDADYFSAYAAVNISLVLSCARENVSSRIGRLMCFRAVTASLQDTEPVGPIFMLMRVNEYTCDLLDEHGKVYTVAKEILEILRDV